MSTPRPSEADVEALAKVLAEHPPTFTEYAVDPTTTFYCKPCSERAGDWVTWTPEHVAPFAARVSCNHPHHGFAAHDCGPFQSSAGYRQMLTARAEAAERALADLRGEIEAVRALVDAAEQMEANSLSRTFTGEPFPAFIPAADLRALLPRDDAAGAGGAE